MITLKGLKEAFGFVIVVAAVLGAAYICVVLPMEQVTSFNVYETVEGLRR